MPHTAHLEDAATATILIDTNQRGNEMTREEYKKEIINTSIEEIEYAIIRPQYVEVYLNNAIRFLKEQQ